MGILLDLVKYLGILFIGALIGYSDVIKGSISNNLERIQDLCLLFLLFTMGITIGLDSEVVNNLFSIGFNALIISLFTIVFSIIFVRLIKKLVYLKENKNEY